MGEAENVSQRRTVGRYRLYSPIAAGGMATVHYGRMNGPLGFSRTVAIKRLHPEFARDPEFVAMFMDEARLAARVRHPNVVQTLDVVASEGELFLVLEYVPAVSLSQLLLSAQARQERAPPAIAAAIAAGVLEGLHAAHEATDEEGNPLDIVHRDVSPQNILVGADGIARVLDFGVAKATGRSGQVTREGQVKGKFAYMAPEQVTNVGVTRQSDVFAASIVLWEALTGRRLFQAESEPALLARVLSGPIDLPSAVVPAVGTALDPVLARGLARDLSVRYGTGRAMARDLEAHLPLASVSQVGEWVERLAGDDLAQRAARVAEIENESRIERVSLTTALADTAGPLAAAEDASATWLPSRRRRGLAVAAVAAALGIVSVAVAIRLGHPATIRAAAAAATANAESAPTPAHSAVLSVPGAVAAKTPAQPSTAPTLPAPGPTKSAEPRAPAARRAVRSPAAEAPCDPPYYADSKGHLIYKPECFR